MRSDKIKKGLERVPHRALLHATGLNFIHPVNGAEIDLEDNIAKDLDESLAMLKTLN